MIISHLHIIMCTALQGLASLKFFGNQSFGKGWNSPLLAHVCINIGCQEEEDDNFI